MEQAHVLVGGPPQAGGAPSQLPGETAPIVAGWLLFGRLEMNSAAAVALKGGGSRANWRVNSLDPPVVVPLPCTGCSPEGGRLWW